MSHVKARQLLFTIAGYYSQQQEFLSREDVLKKIHDIKYLAAQKKIPRLTLRKELIHLENKLHHVVELEQKLRLQEKQESTKILALKQQITQLKSRLVTTEDADLQKKVDKLSHLLGECLAQKRVSEDVELQQREELELPREEKEEQLAALLQRLIALRQMLEMKEDIDPYLAKRLGERITALEDRLKSLQEITLLPKGEELLPQEELPRQVKHTLIFHTPPPQKKFR